MWSPQWDSLEARLSLFVFLVFFVFFSFLFFNVFFQPEAEAVEPTRPFVLDSWQSVKSVRKPGRQVGHPITHHRERESG